MGDAAPIPTRDGSPGPRPVARRSGGRRDLPGIESESRVKARKMRNSKSTIGAFGAVAVAVEVLQPKGFGRFGCVEWQAHNRDDCRSWDNTNPVPRCVRTARRSSPVPQEGMEHDRRGSWDLRAGAAAARAYIASPPCSSAGCSGPITGPLIRGTWTTTSTSSSSASIAAARDREGCCSIA